MTAHALTTQDPTSCCLARCCLQVIPAENLVAAFQPGPGRLMGVATSAADARVMLEALEAGTAGVLLRTEDPLQARETLLACCVESVQHMALIVPKAQSLAVALAPMFGLHTTAMHTWPVELALAQTCQIQVPMAGGMEHLQNAFHLGPCACCFLGV